jgi:hypothetical protein
MSKTIKQLDLLFQETMVLWNLITAARTTSLVNGGLTDIFHKVNSDPTFRAVQNDIIGRWECQNAGGDVIYPEGNNQTYIMQDLYQKNLLYDYEGHCASNFIGKNCFTQFVVWTSPVDDWSQDLAGLTPDEIIHSSEMHLWDVRAAVDMSPNESDDKIMRPFHCTVNAPSVEYILGKIQPHSTLIEFCPSLWALIFGYSDDNVPLATDPGIALASMLGQIMMSGSMTHDTISSEPPALDTPTQGCLALRTQVSISVIIVWSLTTAVLMWILLYWLVLVVRVDKALAY